MMRRVVRALSILTAVCAAPAAAQSPLTSAVTYQGELRFQGQGVAGPVDLRFRLYDSLSAGQQVGAAIDRPGVSLVQGRFTQNLDFGPAAFGGSARWLEIDVRSPAGAGTYVTLSPRQEMTAVPSAWFSARPWVTNGTSVSYTGGFVGIGTTSPLAPLDVRSGTSSFVRVDAVHGDIQANGGLDSAFGIYNVGASTGRTEIIGQNTVRLAVLNTGNVGIGTSTPAARLDVRGDIRLGPTGQYRALGGEENLRMVRGIISPNPNNTGPVQIVAGSGFTVAQEGAGRIRVTFATPFAGVPAVTGAAYQITGCPPWVLASEISANSVLMGVQCESGQANWPFSFIAVGPR